MIVLGCDPGTTESSLVLFNGHDVVHSVALDNEKCLQWLQTACTPSETILAVEWIESFGMAVGREVFETCFWIGRFVQAWPKASVRITRRQVKLHLCGSTKAKDPNIRQALLDKCGHVGTTKRPGPLYGISKHKWSALAVAVTYFDTREEYRLPEAAPAAETKEF